MKRALVLGSQIEGLRGVENDTLAMKAMLEAREFKIDLRTDDQATRDGILAGYEALIEQSGPDDTAVVYYSGHGFYGAVAGQSTTWQCIAPTDLRDGTQDDFRGITAWELSILQGRLTQKTRNVTVILDCCHSSQMSRDAAVRDAVPRALPNPVELGFAAHLDALRAKYGAAFAAVDPVGNPDAVRLVACAQSESAFDYRNPDGKYCGAFTEALIAVLKEVGGAAVSWAAICDAIRALVLRRFPIQRPDVEGPAQRRLFSLVEDNDRGIVTIRKVGDKFELPGGRLTGVVLGDVYGVMPVGSASYAPATAIAEVEVTELLALTAQAKVRAWKNANTTIPVDAVAIPIVRNATKRAVALDVPGAARPAIEKAITEARTLRVANPGEPALATLRLTGDQLTIEDPAGPLFPPAPFPADLEPTIKNVANLGVAQAIRELEGEHGVFRNELGIELGTVEAGALWPLHDHRAALGLRDRFYIQVKNCGDRQLFVHVFNVGVRGKVTLLTKNAAPSGVALESGDPPFVLGKRPDGELRGVGIFWPKGLPQAGFPRVDEYFVFVTSSKVSLASLETQFHIAGATQRGSGTKLQELLAQVHDGMTRDSGGGRRSSWGALRPDRYHSWRRRHLAWRRMRWTRPTSSSFTSAPGAIPPRPCVQRLEEDRPPSVAPRRRSRRSTGRRASAPVPCRQVQIVVRTLFASSWMRAAVPSRIVVKETRSGSPSGSPSGLSPTRRLHPGLRLRAWLRRGLLRFASCPHVGPLPVEHRCQLVDRRCPTLPQLRRVVPIPDLPQRRAKRLFDRLAGLRVDPLQLEDHARFPLDPRDDHHVAAAQAGLPVGAHLVARAQTREQPHDEAVVEALGRGCRGVEVGEVVQYHVREMPFHDGRVPAKQGIEQGREPVRAADLGFEPGSRHAAKRDHDLGVGHRQLGQPLGIDHADLDRLEITSEQEKAPDRVRAAGEIAQRDALVDRLVDRAAREQDLELGLHTVGAGKEQIAHEIVRAGVDPVRQELLLRAAQKAEDRPWVVDGRSPEEIAIIERTDAVHELRLPDGLDESAHLWLGEAEVRRQLGPENAEHIDIVQAREQALSGDTENASEHAFEQVLVVLEASREEITEERDDVIVIVVGIAGVDG